MVVSQPEDFTSDHVLQMLSKACQLAEKSGKTVQALCVGRHHEGDFSHMFAYGADEVIYYPTQHGENVYHLSNIVTDTLREKMPEVVMFPATETGKAVAAITSVRMNAGLTADCIDVEVDDDNEFYFTRAALNDSVIAKIKCINCDLKMCTVKANVFVKSKKGDGLRGILHYMEHKPRPDTGRTAEIIDKTPRIKQKDIDIQKYPVVFCIGRGVGSIQTRDKIIKLAERYCAGVVGTRAAVDENLVEQARQVGQSGKIISPRTYIAFGVSGASQHIVGVKNAGNIIAVNRDSKAPIFEYADCPIVESIDNIINEMEKR